jgi:hypothetical protein
MIGEDPGERGGLRPQRFRRRGRVFRGLNGDVVGCDDVNNLSGWEAAWTWRWLWWSALRLLWTWHGAMYRPLLNRCPPSWWWQDYFRDLSRWLPLFFFGRVILGCLEGLVAIYVTSLLRVERRFTDVREVGSKIAADRQVRTCARNGGGKGKGVAGIICERWVEVEDQADCGGSPRPVAVGGGGNPWGVTVLGNGRVVGPTGDPAAVRSVRQGAAGQRHRDPRATLLAGPTTGPARSRSHP